MGDADLVRNVFASLKRVHAFQVEDYANRLFNIARNSPDVAKFKSSLPGQKIFGPEVKGTIINGRDEASNLQGLAVQGIIRGLSSLNRSADRADFTSCVNKVSVQVCT